MLINRSMVEHLRNLPSDLLRAIKIGLSEARGNTYEHQVFTVVDRILTDREGITQFKYARAGECVWSDPVRNLV